MKNTTPAQRILLAAGAVCFVYGLSFVLPFFDLYYMAENESRRTETVPGYQSGFIWWYGLYLLLGLLALLTFRKIVVHIVNPLLLLAALATFGVNVLLFGWWGASPWHPDFGYGYYVCAFSVAAMTVVSYASLPFFAQVTIPKGFRYTCTALLFVIPVTVYVAYSLEQQAIAAAPRKTAELYNEKDGVSFHEEWWDWKGEHARYTRYLSKPTDNTGPYRLDSIKIEVYAAENPVRVVRSVTKPAVNGKLDPKELLEK